VKNLFEKIVLRRGRLYGQVTQSGAPPMSSQNPVFIPGPTNIPDSIRKACDIGTIDHRSPAFARVFRPAVAGVRRVMGMAEGQGEVIVLPSTGTGGWEAAITNTLSPGDTVLAARFGMFSHRWIELCRKHGLQVEVIETPWGEGAPLAAIAAALQADRGHRIKAVLATHNETATGVRSDIGGIRRAMVAHPAMLFVDGVSSVGSMPFHMADWGVDVAVAGSQKGFMLPAGLAILGVSPKALTAMETARLPRSFFDFADMLKSCETGGFPYTPPVGLINGLAHSVALLEDEGLEAVYARHARLAEGVRRAVAAWGMVPCAARPELYSHTVTAVVVPAGCDGTDLVKLAAEKYGVAFGVGLGEVAGKVFRIGHLGSLTDVMMLSGLACAEMCMADLGWPVKLGSGVAAAQEFYRGGVATEARAAA